MTYSGLYLGNLLLPCRVARPACLAFCSPSWNASADSVRIGNQALVLGVDSHNGRIVELADRDSGQDFCKCRPSEASWEIELRRTAPNRCSSRHPRLSHPETARLEQLAPRLERLRSFRRALHVEVIVRLDQRQAPSRWQLAVDAPGERTIQRASASHRCIALPRLRNANAWPPFWAGLRRCSAIPPHLCRTRFERRAARI